MPENFTSTKRTYLHRSIPRSVRRAALVRHAQRVRAVGASSTGSASPATGSAVAPWGVEAAEQRGRASPRSRPATACPGAWFLFPAFTWPHKNHALLLRAFARWRPASTTSCWCSPAARARPRPHVRDQIAGIGLSGAGPAHRADPAARRAGHRAGRGRLTFPSRYEGFGLPVLEAMASAARCSPSDAGACPRWSATPARLARPVDDADAWADAMTRAARGRRRSASAWSTPVVPRVAGFTWRNDGRLHRSTRTGRRRRPLPTDEEAAP